MEDLMAPIGPLPDGTDIQHYGYQVWMGHHRGHAFTAMVGLHGQYIVAVHDLDLVAVRTGFDRPKGKLRHIDLDVYSTIDLAFDGLGSEWTKTDTNFSIVCELAFYQVEFVYSSL